MCDCLFPPSPAPLLLETSAFISGGPVANLAAKECGEVFLTNRIATQPKSGFWDEGGMENERLVSRAVPGPPPQLESQCPPKPHVSLWGESPLPPAPGSPERTALIPKFPQVACARVGEVKEIGGFESAAACSQGDSHRHLRSDSRSAAVLAGCTLAVPGGRSHPVTFLFSISVLA